MADQLTPLPVKTKTNGDVVAKIVDAAGTNVASVDASGRQVVAVATITAGTGATDLGKAEDAVHASGDTGVMALAVRQDSATALANASGDYIPLITDASGRLHVNVGSITAGTGATDLGKAEDAVHTSGDTGIMALAVRKDTATALANADGDYQPFIADASGRLHVNVGNTVSVTVGGANSPKKVVTSFSALTAGLNITLQSQDITGTTGKLVKAVISSSVPFKAEIGAWSGASLGTFVTMFASSANPQVVFDTPGSGAYTTQAAGAGNRFAARITNMDNLNAADVYMSLFWDEV